MTDRATIVGFTLAAVIYFGLAKLFPIPQAREVDEYDIFGTFV
jgi:cytosine/uracil/thiamine/allantoin permease